jgi:hypothetical protein
LVRSIQAMEVSRTVNEVVRGQKDHRASPSP